MKITYATNFLRVFKVPDKLTADYFFGGKEYPAVFKIVDWFNAISPENFQKAQTTINQSADEYTEWVETVRNFIKGKQYFNPKFTYMVLTDYGAVFIVNPEKRTNDLEEQYNSVIMKTTL